MTIAYYCVLFMGLFPYVAAGIAKKGFDNYDNGAPREWLAQQTGFRARANAAQANQIYRLAMRPYLCSSHFLSDLKTNKTIETNFNAY